jgi:hypothetical protein
MTGERFLRAVALAALPAAVAALASPPHVYARAILGAGAFLGSLPAAYLVAGAVRARSGVTVSR